MITTKQNMFKMIKTINNETIKMKDAIVLFSFSARNSEELTVKANEKVQVNIIIFVK